jgi:uncharacterized integral membrane protein
VTRGRPTLRRACVLQPSSAALGARVPTCLRGCGLCREADVERGRMPAEPRQSAMRRAAGKPATRCDAPSERPGRGRRRVVRIALIVGAVVAVLLFVAPVALAASGNNVGRNLGSLLRQYAGEVYAGVIAIVSLVFLINRRYTELGLFLLAAVVVGWMVFSPDQVAHAAREIGNQILR